MHPQSSHPPIVIPDFPSWPPQTMHLSASKAFLISLAFTFHLLEKALLALCELQLLFLFDFLFPQTPFPVLDFLPLNPVL